MTRRVTEVTTEVGLTPDGARRVTMVVVEVALVPTTVAASIPTITMSVPGAGDASGDGIYQIVVDWDNNGGFTDTGEDVTARLRGAPATRLTRGNATGRRILPPRAGSASYMLDNQSGDYYPDNGTSPLSGDLKPGRRTRVRVTWDGIVYDLWTGFIDDLDINPLIDELSVGISALGSLSHFVDKNLSTPVHLGKDTGALINVVLDEVGWPAGQRDIEAGATAVSVWWEEGTAAYTALTRLLDAEGPGALLYENGSGNIVFKNRFFKALDARATISQATFSDPTDPTEVSYVDFDYDHGWRDIINSATIEAVRRDAQASQAVWTFGSSLTVPASGSVSVTARAANPFVSAITPVSGTDFQASGGTLTVSLDRTSGQAVTITFTNTGSVATITELQLRASPLTASSSVVVSASDGSSIDDYGERDDTRDYRWVQYRELAEDLLAGVLEDRKTPRRKVLITLRSGQDATTDRLTDRLVESFAREIGDRVTVVQTRSGLSQDFWIEHIEHEITHAAKIHTTVFTCEEIRAGMVAASEIFILDSATQGVLGTNKLGA